MSETQTLTAADVETITLEKPKKPRKSGPPKGAKLAVGKFIATKDAKLKPKGRFGAKSDRYDDIIKAAKEMGKGEGFLVPVLPGWSPTQQKFNIANQLKANITDQEFTVRETEDGQILVATKGDVA